MVLVALRACACMRVWCGVAGRVVDSRPHLGRLVDETCEVERFLKLASLHEVLDLRAHLNGLESPAVGGRRHVARLPAADKPRLWQVYSLHKLCRVDSSHLKISSVCSVYVRACVCARAGARVCARKNMNVMDTHARRMYA